MATGKVKIFATTTALFAVCAVIFFTLAITAIGKYTAQLKRVHHMEQQILAGKAEILKVPAMIGKLRVADKTNKELQMEVADLTEASEEFDGELAELQKELTLVTVAKLVLEADKAGYTKNLIEARQAVTELREQMGATDGGTRIDDLDEIEESLIELSY
jgi:predicted  nucleic acid-binding Zn-ribbon protein